MAFTGVNQEYHLNGKNAKLILNLKHNPNNVSLMLGLLLAKRAIFWEAPCERKAEESCFQKLFFRIIVVFVQWGSSLFLLQC
ncbi:MAG: hypothetical protein ACYDBJ_26615 [Aggregatilineales bacterium]